MAEENYPKHTELFEVVLIQDGVHEFTAKPSNLRRVVVTAPDPLAAMLDDEVHKTPGWRPLCATKPGVMTDPEVAARRRELEGPAVDYTKI